MHRRIAISALLACAACELKIERPELDVGAGVQALLILIAPTSGPPSLRVFELPAPGPNAIVLDPGEEPATVLVAEYGCSLVAAGLAGPDQIALEAGAGVPIPPPDLTLQKTSAHSKLDAPFAQTATSVLSRFALRASSLAVPPATCPTLVASVPEQRITDPAPGDIHAAWGFGVALDEERALFGVVNHNRFYVSKPDGTLDKFELPVTPAPDDGAFVSPQGTLYLFGGDNAAWWGPTATATLTATTSLSSTVGTYLHQVDGSRTAGMDLEMFEISAENGEFERYDGHHWFSIDRPHRDQNNAASVVWVGPQEAIATGTREDTSIVHYRGPHLPLEEQHTPGNAAVTAARWIEGTGVVLGTDDGRLLRLKQAQPQASFEFETLVDLEASLHLSLQKIRVLVPARGGILFGGNNGDFFLYRSGQPVCESDLLISGDNTIRYIAAERDDFAYGRQAFSLNELYIGRLRFPPPPTLGCPK
jgi:hypothetical protein